MKNCAGSRLVLLIKFCLIVKDPMDQVGRKLESRVSGGLSGVNRFGPRPKPITISELPACLIHVASDERIKESNGYTEREIKVIVEFACVPKEDSESELFKWSEKLEELLLLDEMLKSLTTEIFLDDISFLTVMDGETPVAALSQVYLLRYLSQRVKDPAEPLPKELYVNDELFYRS